REIVGLDLGVTGDDRDPIVGSTLDRAYGRSRRHRTDDDPVGVLLDEALDVRNLLFFFAPGVVVFERQVVITRVELPALHVRVLPRSVHSPDGVWIERLAVVVATDTASEGCDACDTHSYQYISSPGM